MTGPVIFSRLADVRVHSVDQSVSRTLNLGRMARCSNPGSQMALKSFAVASDEAIALLARTE